MNRSPDPGWGAGGLGRDCAALLFSFDSFIVQSVLWFFFLCFWRRDEFAKSGHVSRSLCAFAMNKLTCTLMGRLLTQLATSVHSVWWNACLLMQIFIQDLSNLFNMLWFYFVYVKLKSPFFLGTFWHPDAKPVQCRRWNGALAIQNGNISSWHILLEGAVKLLAPWFQFWFG